MRDSVWPSTHYRQGVALEGRAHLGIGVVSAGVVMWMAQSAGAPVSTGTVAAGVVVAGLGSLAPDIDHPKSLIGNRLPASLFASGLVLVLASFGLKLAASDTGLLAAVWTSLLQWTSPMLKWGVLLVALGVGMLFVSLKVTGAVQHRGPTHSLAAAGVATVVSFVVCLLLGLGPWIGSLFGLGWFLHLFADATTPTGLPSLLWPSDAEQPSFSPRILGILLIPLMLFGATGWFFSSKALLSGWAKQGAPVSTNPGVPASTSDVSLARERLREAAPDIERALVNADTPRVESKGGNTSYTWQYLRKESSNRVATGSITVTLDGSGQIIGVSGQ